MCQPAFHSAASVSSSGMPIGTTGSWLPSLGTLIDDVPWAIMTKQVAGSPYWLLPALVGEHTCLCDSFFLKSHSPAFCQCHQTHNYCFCSEVTSGPLGLPSASSLEIKIWSPSTGCGTELMVA